MQPPISIVILISGSGSNLQAVMDEIAAGNVRAKVSAVICNQPGAYGIERAQKHAIPTKIVDHTLFSSRETFDEALREVIDGYQPDLVVLAGFMRILSHNFVRHYMGRMINIHPSLLPAYKGINTHQRVLQDGVKIHGASVHFVTPELDGGPLIIQASVVVKDNDTVDSLAKRVLKKEHVIFPLVIDWFASKRLKLKAGKVIFDGAEIDRIMNYENT